MNYRTCYGCKVDKDACPRLKTLRERLSGLHITSVAFKCPERVPHFKTGDRVTVTWPFHEGDGYYTDEIFPVPFAATVVSEKKPGRFRIRVDDGPCADPEEFGYSCPDDLTGNGHASVSFTRLEKRDEPAVNVCATCNGVLGKTAEKDCYGTDSPFFETRCSLREATQ